MVMATLKEEVIQLIQELPDQCTFEDIKYRLYVKEMVEEGLAQIAEGRVTPHDQVEAEVEQWLGSWRK